MFDEDKFVHKKQAVELTCKMNMGIISVRMDKETKEKFTDFCKSVGITVSAAVNMFARMTIQENRLPFDVKRFPKQ